MKYLTVLFVMSFAVSSGGAFVQADGPPVKKSKTGICHAKGSTYYEKTKNFTPYQNIDSCIQSGGRLPKA